jgi:hypothetical protein
VCIHLAPPWIFSGHDSIPGADIGGSNIRIGIVALNLRKAPDLSSSKVLAAERWCHADDQPHRDVAVERLAGMLRAMITRADNQNLQLVPFIGIGCPRLIREDGSIEEGGQVEGQVRACGTARRSRRPTRYCARRCSDPEGRTVKLRIALRAARVARAEESPNGVGRERFVHSPCN